MNKLKKIMCIDDQPDILKIARLSLEKIGGFEVHICIGGKQALKDVEEIKPDLILLDVMMPEMDGIETIKELRKIEFIKLTPVVFLTAKVRPQEIQSYKDLGASGVLTKPFDAMSLPKEVQKIWDEVNA